MLFCESGKHQAHEHDRENMRTEKDQSDLLTVEHGGADARNDEQRSRSGTQRAHPRRLRVGDQAVFAKVRKHAAAHGIARQRAHRKAVGGDARHLERLFAQRRQDARGALGDAQFREQRRQNEKREQRGEHEIQPQLQSAQTAFRIPFGKHCQKYDDGKYGRRKGGVQNFFRFGHTVIYVTGVYNYE